MRWNFSTVRSLILTTATLFGLFSPVGVAAQSEVADLDFEIVVFPEGPKQPGSRGHLRFTITNNGPDPAATVGKISVTASNLPSLTAYDPIIRLDSLDGGQCVPILVVDDGPPEFPVSVRQNWLLDRLEPGDAITCRFQYFIDPKMWTADIPWDWWVRASPDTDPTPNHPIVQFPISTAAPIPTLSTPGIIILILALLGAFSYVRYRLRTTPQGGRTR